MPCQSPKYYLIESFMRKIPCDAIESGMVLAKPVVGPNGNILLGKGAVLQAGMANRLQSWGIPFVAIEGEQDEAGDGSGGKKIDPAELEKELRERFADVIKDHSMNMIYQETFQFLLKKGSG